MDPADPCAAVLAAIDRRASALRLSAPAPTPEQLQRMLCAAVRAPDHGRLGPWRFVVLEGDSRSRMAEALAGHLRRKRPDTSAAALDAERAKAQRAPLILVVAARPLRGHKVPEIEQILAVGAAIENLLLAAQALGYGTMWKTGEAAYDAQVKTELGLEPGDHVVGFIYIGTVAAAGQPRTASLEGLVQRL